MEVQGSDLRTEATALAYVARKLFPWHAVYFLLVGVNLLTLTASLYVQRGMSRMHSDTVAVGQQWERRSDQYARLGQLAKALNAPGHTVLTSQEPQREAVRARNAFDAFIQELDQARSKLKNDPALAQLLLRRQLDELQTTATMMVAETDQIFGHFAAKQLDTVRDSMARLDDLYGEITVRLFALQHDTHVVQREDVGQQEAQATTFTQQQALLIGIVTLLVMMVTLYGYRLSTQEMVAEQENAHWVTTLERNEARLHNIVSSVPHSVTFQYRQTPDGSAAFSYVSLCSSTTLGVDASVTLNDPASLADLLHTDDRPAFAHAISESARLLLPWRWEGRMVTRNGTCKWMQGTATPQSQTNGDILWDGLFVDTSEQKQREEELRKSEERFALAMEGAGDGLWDWDVGSNDLYISPRLKNTLGYRDAVVRTVNDFAAQVHAEDRDRVIQAVREYLGEKTRFDVEYRVKMGDGQYLWVQSRGQGVWDEAGKPVRMVGSMRDISKSKQIDRVLRASEERFRFLCAASPVGIFETDTSGACTYINPQLCEIAGLTSGQAKDDTLTNAIVEEDKASVLEDWQACVWDGRNFSREYRYQHASGEIRWVHRQAVAVYGEDSRLRGYVGTVEDITDRKQAEAVQQRYLQDMEEARTRIEEQTVFLQVQAKELSEATQRAEQASQTKSEFLATMSHEIRTPMNGVIGMTGLLLDTDLTSQQREFAEIIKGSGEALLSIINNILDFSKVEAGKMDIEVMDFDLRSAVEETLELLATKAQEKGLELAHFLPADVPTAVRGDPGRLRQILLNLVSNALKFTEHGEVTVRVTRAYDVSTLTLVRFAVSDTGIGIAPDRLDRLFQAFSQAGW